MNNNHIVPGFDKNKNETLRIELTKAKNLPSCLVLSLIGYCDIINAEQFRKRVFRAINAGFTRLVFNCAGFNFVSSIFIDCLLAFRKELQPKGGDFILAEVQPLVFKCFQMLGFSKFFHFAETNEEAISSFHW